MVAAEASLSNASTLAHIFQHFETLSGLQVSKQKSSIIFSRAVRRKQGRAEHIRTVVTPTFHYWCYIYNLPISIINSIQKMCRDFLWGSKDYSRKMHLMNWDMISRPKAEGGLGVRKLLDVQMASKCVLAWDYLTSKDRLWVSWFQKKYAAQISYWNVLPRYSSSTIWKAVVAVRDIMLQHTNFIVGSGTSISTFLDPWCDKLTVVQRFGQRVVRSLHLNRRSSLDSLLLNGSLSKGLGIVVEVLMRKLPGIIFVGGSPDKGVDVAGLLIWFHNLNHQAPIRINLLPAIIWGLWQERNSRLHDGPRNLPEALARQMLLETLDLNKLGIHDLIF
ncbi:uncharacterized protein LOC132304693 [Cornus florida]|uniref:uncharacterized protein LOC132304693 n=1 Tax=Cornus florida TaxID=4283 RepID=UPI00289A1F60|nr:uncharacterized protein LOC132304693 [Cornus florida]